MPVTDGTLHKFRRGDEWPGIRGPVHGRIESGNAFGSSPHGRRVPMVTMNDGLSVPWSVSVRTA